MELGIDDRTALVTGGAGRIGTVVSETLAEEGAEVAVLDVDESGAKEVASDIQSAGGEAFAVACDLTDREEVREVVEDVEDRAGGVDILVNNAGLVDARGRAGEFDDDLWDRDLDVNLTGTYNITKALFPRMRERGWGRVVTLSSVAGTHGGFGQLSYSTTKAGLTGFAKTLALEGAPDGVTSNALAPNIVVGELAELDVEQIEEINPYFARIVEATPAGQLGTEEDVAGLVAYLASEQASYVTGQVIGVTGGVDLFSY
jgi:3-oxoacyl-[acyl-carrier protein] reductase